MRSIKQFWPLIAVIGSMKDLPLFEPADPQSTKIDALWARNGAMFRIWALL
jgi:hypothetical protein